MENQDVGRIFVVGCSRSGTTLLQSLLASHSRVHTFPETGIFLRTFGMRGTVLPWTRIGLTLGKERKALARLRAAQVDAPHSLPALPPRRISLARSVSEMVEFLDGLARAHGKDVWVEKTPRHVLHARRIGRWVPGARCVHMVRGGEDVVASIVDRARRYPGRFPGQDTPSYGIRQWNRSMRATVESLRDPGHAVVFYDALAGDPEAGLRALCPFLGLVFEAEMVTPADSSTFVHASEEWKSQVKGPVAPARSKFEDLFDPETRSSISRSLDQGAFQKMRARASSASGEVLISGE